MFSPFQGTNKALLFAGCEYGIHFVESRLFLLSCPLLPFLSLLLGMSAVPLEFTESQLWLLYSYLTPPVWFPAPADLTGRTGLKNLALPGNHARGPDK